MQLLTETTAARDGRGALHVLTSGTRPWRELCRIECRPGALRGNHYHAVTTELLFVLRGSVHVTVRTLAGQLLHDGVLPAGMGVVLEPGEAHAVRALADTELLSARTTPFTEESPDLHAHHVVSP